ncbi:MAG: hypothetical protein J6126_04075, partial [Clostridia bacterium]|nr:hypothetical protein [Clostridia bacterium]
AEVTVKKAGVFHRRRHAALKRELMEKVNGAAEVAEEEQAESAESVSGYSPYEFADKVEVTTKRDEKAKNRGKGFKFDIVAAQVAVIAVLALTIMLTNIFWQDSGINSLIRGVFFSEPAEKDASYTDFKAAVPASASVDLNDGVMTFSGGSIYPVCDGVITKVAQNADKLDISIKYSPSFTALISGAEYAYLEEGDSVYKSVPVCYSSGEVKVYLYSDGKLITNYAIDGGRIVWQS